MFRQAIIKSLPDGSAYPAGCIYEVSQGGGCALLFQTDGKAMKLLFIAILHYPPRVLLMKLARDDRPCRVSLLYFAMVFDGLPSDRHKRAKKACSAKSCARVALEAQRSCTMQIELHAVYNICEYFYDTL